MAAVSKCIEACLPQDDVAAKNLCFIITREFGLPLRRLLDFARAKVLLTTRNTSVRQTKNCIGARNTVRTRLLNSYIMLE